MKSSVRYRTNSAKVTGHLRESEEEFRAMFELSAMGIAEVDIKTKHFVRANRKFCEITGYTAAELSKLTIAEITHPDDRRADNEAIQRAMRGETAGWISEKRYLRKNRDHIWVKVTGAVIFDDKGRPLRMIGAVEDITLRRQAEAALRESENRYRLIFERAGDAIFILEAEGKQAGQIVAANRTAAADARLRGRRTRRPQHHGTRRPRCGPAGARIDQAHTGRGMDK